MIFAKNRPEWISLRAGFSTVSERVSPCAIEVVVVVLARVGENSVKIFAALGDDRRQPDDLRPGAYDDQQFKLAVVPEGLISISFYPANCFSSARRLQNMSASSV